MLNVKSGFSPQDTVLPASKGPSQPCQSSLLCQQPLKLCDLPCSQVVQPPQVKTLHHQTTRVVLHGHTWKLSVRVRRKKDWVTNIDVPKDRFLIDILSPTLACVYSCGLLCMYVYALIPTPGMQSEILPNWAPAYSNV